MKTETWQLLVVDNDPVTQHILKIDFIRNNCMVFAADSGAGAMQIIEKIKPQFVLINKQLNDIDGIALSEKIHSLFPAISIVLMVGYPELDTTLKAVNNSIYDYIIKPFKSEQVQLILNRAARENRNRMEIKKNLEQIAFLSAENHRLQEIINRLVPAKSDVINTDKTKLSKYSQKKVINTYRQHSMDNNLNEEL